jgi:SAM-dependent methyltransferase/uncharacterized protein YbaR (Trm112 family)
MNEILIESLVCPSCRTKLDLVSLDTHAAERASEREVIAGVLRCSCGKAYPIIDGVPRLLEAGLEAFPEFVTKHRQPLTTVLGSQVVKSSKAVNNGHDDYENIRRSFSQEWGIFDYDSDKTWGWTLEERKRVFLADVNLEPQELSGRRMLDAGCGNGTLTAALSAFGVEIVGLDLNDGLGRAYGNRGKYAREAGKNVQYVQGNLVTPPLKPGAFDLIYSSGVIHHTPSSKNTFASLVPLVKKGGRMYVWVYGRRGFLVRAFFTFGRGLRACVSLKTLMRVCSFLAPPYKLSASVLNALGIMQFRNRTTREVTLDLFDAFAPKFNHFHSEPEVRAWFVEHGFTNINLSGVQKHGFGMYGDKL